MKYLLDTNVVSELRKGSRAHTRVLSWYAGTESDEKYLSVLTVGEVRRGIENVRGRDPVQARALDRWLERLLATHADRVLSIDAAIAEQWGRLSAARSMPVIDALLAATALVHGLTFATRNVRDVSRSGVPTVNPFEEPRVVHGRGGRALGLAGSHSRQKTRVTPKA